MKIISILLVMTLIISGCQYFDRLTTREKAGAGIGALGGGLLGLIANDGNPWKGVLLGSVGGALIGGIIGNIIDYASKESSHRSAPVKYYRTTKDGLNEEVYASPSEKKGNYKEVNVKYYRNGKLTGEEVKKEYE